MSTSGILAGLTALVVGVVPAGAAAQHPDLAGSWKLNQAQSDNPRDQMRGSDSTGGERRPRGEGTFGRMASDTTLYKNMNATLMSLDSLLTDLRLRPGRYLTVKVF